MQVILLERVQKLGQMGDVVQVRDGYARNYLLPQRKAMRATETNRKLFENQRAQLEATNLERKTEGEAVAEKLNGQAVVLIRQASERGQLYGSVSGRDIATVLTESGFTVVRGQIILNSPIKSLGITEVPVRLHPEVEATISVNVARSEEEAERQARGEDVTIDADDLAEEEEFVSEDEEFFEEGADTGSEDGSDDAEASAEPASDEEKS